MAQVVSQFGDAVVDLAVLVLVAVNSHSGLLVGLVLFAQLLPTALFGAFFGPVADRKSPKWLMVGADLFRLLMVLLMIPFQHNPFLLVVLVACIGLGTALFSPARSSAVPQVVGEENIPQAMSLSQGTWSAMRIAGPAAGGALLAVHNTTAIFLIDAGTFLVSALLIVTLKSVRALGKTAQEEGYFRSLGDGVRQVVGMPALRFLLLMFIPVTLSAGMFNTDFNAVLLNTFRVPQFHFGLIDSVSAAGTIAGALCAPILLRRFRPSTMLLSSFAAIGVGMMLVLGVNQLLHSFGLAPVYVWSIVVGFLNATLNVPLSSLFMATTPASFRGRGGALLQAAVNFGSLAGILVGGWLAAAWSALTATTIAGIILLGTAVVFPWFKGYRDLHAVAGKRRQPTDKPQGSSALRNGETQVVEAKTIT